MSCIEEAVSFACENEALIGVLSRPRSTTETGVVIIVGGPQYRVGSHRQFVLLARALADGGFAVLRFDVRGMGDSGGEPRSFDTAGDDVAAAIDALQRRVPGVKRIVLLGLCDGASAALLYCQAKDDARVCGLCLLNPWVRSEASLAVTHVKHYYTRRLLQPEFWRKLARGEVGAAAARAALRSVRTALAAKEASSAIARHPPFQERMAEGWSRFEGNILLVLSGDDYTAKEFIEHVRQSAAWKGALRRGKLVRHELPDADHTFSSGVARVAMETLTVNWLRESSSETSSPTTLPASSVER
jgi:exosortase A-associated hydrolase 1